MNTSNPSFGPSFNVNLVFLPIICQVKCKVITRVASGTVTMLSHKECGMINTHKMNT